jgi:hypothetical protein
MNSYKFSTVHFGIVLYKLKVNISNYLAPHKKHVTSNTSILMLFRTLSLFTVRLKRNKNKHCGQGQVICRVKIVVLLVTNGPQTVESVISYY